MKTIALLSDVLLTKVEALQSFKNHLEKFRIVAFHRPTGIGTVPKNNTGLGTGIRAVFIVGRKHRSLVVTPSDNFNRGGRGGKNLQKNSRIFKILNERKKKESSTCF